MKTIKKNSFYILLLATLVSLTGCLKDFKDQETLVGGSKEVVIGITLPESIENEPLSDFKVTLRNQKTGSAYVTQTDEKGEARIGIEYGKYSVTTSKEIEVDGVVKYLRATRDLTLSEDTAEDSKTEMNITVSNKGTIILKEVYFHKAKNPAGTANYANDQYFTLYNNSDKVQYLDGLGIGFHTQFNSMDKCTFSKFWIEGSNEPRDSVPVNAFGLAFPGSGEEYPLKPGEEVVLALNTIDHTSALTNTPINLTGDNVWAMYIPNKTTKQQYTAGVKMMSYFCQLALGTSITLSHSSPVVVIFRIEGDPKEYVKDGAIIGQQWGNVMYQPTAYKSMPSIMIPKEWVYDGVEFKNQISNLTRLCPEISVEPMFISTTAYNHQSYIRKVDEAATAAAGHTIYQDTNDSSKDWMMLEKPTLCTK